jgi:hypothetical protein
MFGYLVLPRKIDNGSERRCEMRQLWVDFNDIDEEGRTTTLARFASPEVALSSGLRLPVGDDDGNICDADVIEISPDGVVTLALDLDSFRHVGKHARLAV